MANPPSNNRGWQREMTRESRIKVCQHVFGKLTGYYPMVTERALQEKTTAFEKQAFANAASRNDYLQRIANGLSNVERQVQKAPVASGNAPHPPANGAAAVLSNPVSVPAPTLQQTAQQMRRQQDPQQLQASGRMPQNRYSMQIQTQLLFQQQQAKQRQQIAAKAAATARAALGSAVNVKTANSRTQSGSSSVTGGSRGGRPKIQNAQLQAMATNALQHPQQGRPASFNGQANAAGSTLAPEFLLALQSQQAQAQFTPQAMQQTAQIARQRSRQSQAASARGRMSGMGRNPSMVNAQSSLGFTGASAPLSGASAVAASPGQSSRSMSAQMLQQQSRLQQGINLQPGNPNPFARAAIAGTGLSVSKMNAIMAQKSNAENMRAAQQRAYGNVPDGVRAQMNQSQAVRQRLQPTPPNAHDTANIWTKLDYMKRKYGPVLRKIASIAQNFANSQPSAKKEQIKNWLKKTIDMLRLERTSNVALPPISEIEKVERFINSVIEAYQRQSQQHQLNAQRAQSAVPPTGKVPNESIDRKPIGAQNSRVPPQQNRPEQNVVQDGQVSMSVKSEYRGPGTSVRGVQQVPQRAPPVEDKDQLLPQRRQQVPQVQKAPQLGKRSSQSTLEHKMQHMQSSVKIALEQAQRLEQYVQNAKAERIQNTLAALHNGSSSAAALTGKKRGLRNSSDDEEDLIKAKTVFESSSERGLRLAKRPKNEAADVKSLKEAVEADCRSAQERNPLLHIEITEEFGKPVVICQVLIEDIKLPKLVLRVQRGYPRKGMTTFGFERPPLGYVGVLDEIRTRFKRSLANTPSTSIGVAVFLDSWVREAKFVIENNLRGHMKHAKMSTTNRDTLKKSAEPIAVN